MTLGSVLHPVQDLVSSMQSLSKLAQARFSFLRHQLQMFQRCQRKHLVSFKLAFTLTLLMLFTRPLDLVDKLETLLACQIKRFITNNLMSLHTFPNLIEPRRSSVLSKGVFENTKYFQDLLPLYGAKINLTPQRLIVILSSIGINLHWWYKCS